MFQARWTHVVSAAHPLRKISHCSIRASVQARFAISTRTGNLTTWLAHSKKRSCDVCKYEYGFTKVYKPDMPKRLPAELFLRKLSVQMAKVVITSLRLVMISIIWLAILPCLTLWVWRFYFWTGEALAYWVVGRELPNRTPPPPATPPTEETTQTPPPQRPLWTTILPHDLGADIFKGQIITIAVVIVFLTIFLLREWIIQNARPGVFGDDEIPEPAPAVPEPAPPPEPAPGPAPEPDVLNLDQVALQEAIQAAERYIQEQGGELVDEVVDRRQIFRDYQNSEDEDEDVDMDTEEDNDSMSIVSQRDVASMSSGPEAGEGQPEDTNVPTPALQINGAPTESLATQRAEQSTSTKNRDLDPSSSGTDGSSDTIFGASTRLGGDVSLTSSFAFSSPGTGSRSFAHSAESSLDGSLPPDSQMYSSLSSNATQSPIRSSIGELYFTVPLPHATSSQGGPFDVPLPDSPQEARPNPFRSTSTDSLSTASTSATRAPRLIRPLPAAGPSRRMISSTPAFKGNREFDDFRFSFSSTPPTLSQSSSRPSSRPPLPPSTPGVDEPVPTTDSPHVALYRPPEDMKSEAGYFDDRSPLAPPSDPTTDLGHAEQPEFAEEDDGEEIPDQGITPLEPDEPMPALEAYDDAPERLIEAPPLEPVIEDRAARQRVFADLEQRVAQMPRAPPIEEDDEEDAQDVEPMGDDDMDGALEAIGMRGPLTSVFQNVFLMIFIIDLAIAVGIWMPFTMGKTTALLFLQPADVLALIRFPIIAVRIMTDPIVDGLLFLLNLLFRPFKWGIARVFPFALSVTKPVTEVPPPPKTGLNLTVIQDAAFHHWDRLVAHAQAAVDPSVPKPSPTNVAERIIFRLPAPSMHSLEQVEGRFSAFGRAVRLFSHAFARRWQQLTIADGTAERAFAICLGYAVLCMVMGIYLGVLNTGAVRGAARALRNAVKQQLIVVKVALFIGLELLVFPTGCGVVLDIATLPLFESATLAGRIAFYDFAPLTAFFCHWLVGTIFMYQFALTLGACRAVMRPGAMWFIKDPQDASFSPIRDILDKRVLTQLRKLAVSAVMYTVVIVVAVGSVVYTIRYAPIFSGILPLRGNMREPLSEIPVDLLFLHLVMPPTVKRLTIGSWMKARLEVWWKFTARQLRLSSFMFNQLHADELQRESSGLRPMNGPAETWTIPSDEHLYGRWLRVPKSDNIAFLRDQPVLIQVDRAGRAVRQRGEEVMAEQDEETRRAGRTPEQDYIIVHVPPFFGLRCLLLVILLWITAASITVSGTIGPILLGRWLLSAFAHKTHVHDGYSLVIGWYVLWGLWRVHRSQVRSWISALAWTANVLCIGIGMGVIMPILVAVTLQMYVVLPLRLWWNPETVPVLRIAEDWALGLVLMKIGWQTWRLRARVPAQAPAAGEVRADEAGDGPDEADRRMEDLGRAMEQIIRAGLTNPDAITATRTFVAPVCGGLALVIAAPGAVVWALGKMYGAPVGGDDALLSVVYPGIFCGTAAVGLWRVGSQAGKKWLQGIRDEEFLVEMRLKNLESK
ncbi:E3 ubiquitin-protein ligase MARCH6 [Rhizoctonia solani]|uniref:RING-type E3 ubiquitin transferase n=1 Tax=Rhizoctonia solani TaxID=456999 RepID=A0A0K6GHX8_9AGAM|nr:E3 ubiquitin-protein ligase MARCH6 [Rhizoctonia solani]